jgi:uncharacterized protein YecA (UPF0149 family)
MQEAVNEVIDVPKTPETTTEVSKTDIETVMNGKGLTKMMKKISKEIPNKQKKKYRLAMLSGSYVEPVKPVVNLIPKIGRNAPCPCGKMIDGKRTKYKKCCGV